MLYDNCSKYIEEIINKDAENRKLLHRTIIIDGMDSMSETVVFLLKENNIENIVLVDDEKRGEVWNDIQVQGVKEVLETIDEPSNYCIIVTDYQKGSNIINDIETSFPNLKECIWDLSYITMNKLPNIYAEEDYGRQIELRRCQEIQLEVLQFFTNFCEENHLRYFLDYGTLLGAVRHKGFIPWDDDIDIAMPVDDYLRLGKIFPKDADFFWDSMFNDGVQDYTISTLSKIKSKKMLTEFRSFPIRTMTGIGIDIFPLCGYPNDYDEQMRYMDEFGYWTRCWKEKIVIPYGTEKYSKKEHMNMFQKMNEIMLRYPYDESEYIGVGYFGYDKPKATDNTRVMLKKWYDEYILCDFETMKCRVPVGYHEVLRKWYGDYTVLPPIEQQKPHGIFKVYMNENKSDNSVWY